MLYECDIVSFEHDTAKLSARLLLPVYLCRLIQHHIHVLVEADDDSLQSNGRILVQPQLHSLLALQQTEDLILPTQTQTHTDSSTTDRGREKYGLVKVGVMDNSELVWAH